MNFYHVWRIRNSLSISHTVCDLIFSLRIDSSIDAFNIIMHRIHILSFHICISFEYPTHLAASVALNFPLSARVPILLGQIPHISCPPRFCLGIANFTPLRFSPFFLEKWPFETSKTRSKHPSK